MEDILRELSKPFHPSHITWKPGVTTKTGEKALGMAYADLRAYQNRLDEVCGMDWSVTYTPWGDRIVCHLTINGVTRSSTGEPDAQSEKSEIAGTASEAQAYKRACAMFGLGRYLYNLPTVWAEYDQKKRKFTEQGLARLNGIIVQHYKRNTGDDSAQETAPVDSQPETRKDEGAPVYTPLHSEFDGLGEELYGDQWEQVRRHNTERISGGQVGDYRDLDEKSIKKLIDGLKKLKRQRKAA